MGLLAPIDGGFVSRFDAMASPCEVRIETTDRALASAMGQAAEDEARRIEAKFSRYRPDSLLSQINASAGRPLSVDTETAALIDYAARCYDLSDGLFDITSGVLRRLWKFDGSDQVPTRKQVTEIRSLIGWDKVGWRNPEIALPQGMEIDFGGLGKEYAVDSAVMKIQALGDAPALVNFGGDLRVSGPRVGGKPWLVAIESVDRPGASEGLLEIAFGALTTSGDARRYLLKHGVRYGHILDPRTGWPVPHPPRSVTVAASTCLEAGLMSTLAMLKGKDAESLLEHEGIRAWCVR